MKVTFTDKEIQEILINHCEGNMNMSTNGCKIDMTSKSYSDTVFLNEIELNFTEKKDEESIQSDNT